MKKFNNEILKKELKKINTYLYWFIILIVTALLFLGLAMFDKSQSVKKSIYLNDVIEKENNKENMNAYLTVAMKPYSFAKYSDDENKVFYIMNDGKFYYIAYLTTSSFNKLNVDDIKEKNKTIYGVTKNIPNDIKKLAIEAFNGGLPEKDKITMEEFNSYFGGVYLDTTSSTTISTILMLLATLTAFFSIIILIIYIAKKVKTNKSLKNISDNEIEIIEREMEDKETFHYEKAHLILTKNYIIAFNSGLSIFKYSDIIWIYEKKMKQYGITTLKSIMVMDTQGKTHALVEVDGVTKKSKLIIEEIFKTIANKNSRILIGYTKENQTKIKENYNF